MNFFPVNLNINGKICSVIGGGKVAERKIYNILKYNPVVKVISKHFTENILKLSNKITLIKDSYNKKYIEKSFIVFICTDNRELNLKIYKDAKNINALVNIVTHPELCDFSVSSIVQRGDLLITISTNGKSPALSKIIRKELEEKYGEEYSLLIKILDKIREKQLKKSSDSSLNKELFYKFLSSNVLDLIKNKKEKELSILIKKIFNFSVDFSL